MSVTDIRYIGYGLPNVEAERIFYRDVWGLREAGEKEGRYFLAAEGDDELFVVRLRPAEHRRLDVIALAADSRAAVGDLFAKVKADDCQIIFETKALSEFGGIHSPHHKAMAQFFVDVLGFRVSDWLGDFMCFLRCNEWHHRLAILPGPPSVNHVAYDMINVDAMMRGVAKLKRNNIDIRWGPGRHTAGNNTFSYFVTPAGFAIEYTSELEQVDEISWKQVYTPSPTVLDQWGRGLIHGLISVFSIADCLMSARQRSARATS